MLNKMFQAGITLVEESAVYDALTIDEGAQLQAPEGKYLTLTVNGVVKSIEPCEYVGDIALHVSDYYIEEVYPSVNRSKPIPLQTAAVIKNGQLVESQSNHHALCGGSITGSSADDIYIGVGKGDYAGIIVDGDTEYSINNAHFDMEGQSNNDFVGMGAAVAALGNAKVTINDSDFRMSAVTRCAVHVGGKSDVTVNHSRMFNYSPDCDLAAWSWGISVRGTNRLNQLADDGVVHYNNCYMTSNGWGVLSVDGSNYASMFVKDSYMELSGPRSHGYGVFCIGPTRVSLDHTKVNVTGFPLMIMGMERKATVDVINGCCITGRRYGVHLIGDTGTRLTIADSTFDTGSSTIVAKGANTDIRIINSTMKPGNNVILQMMDSDDPGLAGSFVDVSIYDLEDTYVEGRELSKIDPLTDMMVTITESHLTGDLYNSTTDLKRKAAKEPPAGIPKRPGLVAPGALAGSIPEEGSDMMRPPIEEVSDGPAGFDGPSMSDPNAPKNLGITLQDSSLVGTISSARQHYTPGLTCIEETTRLQLCNVTQIPAPTVNNGVAVILSGISRWTVEKTSYITALTIGDQAAVLAPEGKCLIMTVDGVPAVTKPGIYTGKIVLEIV